MTLVKDATPQTLIPKARKPVASTSTLPKRKSKRTLIPAVDPAILAAEEAVRQSAAAVSSFHQFILHPFSQAHPHFALLPQAHHATLSTELSARQARLSALTRALRELETQRLLMGKGAKASIISKKGTGPATEDEDGRLVDEVVPDEGVSTGARVFVSQCLRKSFAVC